MAEEVAAKIVQHKIHPSRFKPADGVRNVWVVVPEEGVPYASLLDGSYWSHISEKLRPMDRIEVLPEDGSYFAELIVRGSGRQYANVVELRKVQLDTVAVTSPDNKYEVAWRGPHHKFCVVRTADKTSMQTGFDNKDAALSWLSSNIRSLAA